MIAWKQFETIVALSVKDIPDNKINLIKLLMYYVWWTYIWDGSAEFVKNPCLLNRNLGNISSWNEKYFHFYLFWFDLPQMMRTAAVLYFSGANFKFAANTVEDMYLRKWIRRKLHLYHFTFTKSEQSFFFLSKVPFWWNLRVQNFNWN